MAQSKNISGISFNYCINTAAPTHALNVVGDINATGTIYADGGTDLTPDYVFESYYGQGRWDGRMWKEGSVPSEAKDYKLIPIEELAEYTKTNNQLPPSVVQGNFTTNGGSNNLIKQQYFLLEKVEELTLYTLEQEEKIGGLKRENEAFKQILYKSNPNEQFCNQNHRIQALEAMSPDPTKSP